MSKQNLTTTKRLDKSALFHFYNKARVSGLDRKRVNRALGLVQAGKVERVAAYRARATGTNGATYTVTGRSCTCPDHTRRGVTCKHIAALYLLIRMSEMTQTGEAA